MPESVPCTDAMISEAWQDAIDANSAFDRYKSAGTRLRIVRETANFALEGVVIDNNVFTTLEADLANAKADFDTRMRAPSPLMTAPDSPFRITTTLINVSGIMQVAHIEAKQQLTMEQAINQASPVCYLDELFVFADLQGYNPTIARRAYNVLGRAAKPVHIDSFAAYVSPIDASAAGFGELRIIRSRGPDGKQRHALDKAGILHHTIKGIDGHADIRNFGGTTISFWADYCNHAFPHLEEPLPVTYPPKPKHDATETTRLRELEPRELLLDKVTLHGEGEVAVVTSRSLRRHALSLGYTQHNTPQYAKLLRSIKSHLVPGIYISDGLTVPHRINDWLVYIGERVSGIVQTHWGIKPEAFKSIINRLEASPELRQSINTYTKHTGTVLKQYLEALEPILAKNGSSIE